MLYFDHHSIVNLKCRSGEIGRRTGFKILRGQPRVGSIPTSGTIRYSLSDKHLASFTYLSSNISSHQKFSHGAILVHHTLTRNGLYTKKS